MGYILLQFNMASAIDYAAEKIKAEKATSNAKDVLAAKLKKTRKDFQV